jgi:hypothetical protein
MPQVGSNNEALYERAQYVYTGSLWVPMKADASGQLAVGLIAGQSVQANMAGYFGSAYQKQNMLLGYAGTISEDLGVADAAAGVVNRQGTTVPDGQVWVIQAVAARDSTHALTRFQVVATINSVQCYLLAPEAPPALTLYTWVGELCLAPGDNVSFNFVGVTLHDVLIATYGGRKFYTNL